MLGRLDRLPELRQRVEAARDGVVAAGGVLEVDGDVGLEHLERPRPAADALVDPVLGMAGMDDHRERADRGRGLAGLGEDLARAVADVRLRRADVDQVGSVDVDADLGRAQLLGVVARRRLLPALRVGEEELDAVGADLGGLGERVAALDVRSDGMPGGHMARAGIEPATPRFSVVCSTN